jgi:hypothetical protein
MPLLVIILIVGGFLGALSMVKDIRQLFTPYDQSKLVEMRKSEALRVEAMVSAGVSLTKSESTILRYFTLYKIAYPKYKQGEYLSYSEIKAIWWFNGLTTSEKPDVLSVNSGALKRFEEENGKFVQEK